MVGNGDQEADRPAWYRWQAGDLLLYCHLQPNASADGFAGVHGDRLKIRIGAPPIEGRANARLVVFLATRFGVPKRSVTVEQGESARQKTVRVTAPAQLPAELGIRAP